MPAKPDKTLLQIGAATIRNLEDGGEVAGLHLQLADSSPQGRDSRLVSSNCDLTTLHATAKDGDGFLGAPKGRRRRLHVAETAVAVAGVVVAAGVVSGSVGHGWRKEGRKKRKKIKWKKEEDTEETETAESVRVNRRT